MNRIEQTWLWRLFPDIKIEKLEKELKYLEHASKHTVIASSINKLMERMESLTEQNNTLIEHLDWMCAQADKDCPTKYRTGDFEDTLFWAKEYLETINNDE